MVDILRESVNRLSRHNDLARIGSRDSKDRRGGKGPVIREVPAGAAQHAHEVAVSRSYGSVRLRRRRRRGRRRRGRRRLGTCLTKHSCGRYLVHATARTGRVGPTGDRAMRPKHGPFFRVPGNPGSGKRMAMSRRASVHYQPANVQITAHLLHSARHSFNDTRTRERTAVNPRRALCRPLFLPLPFPVSFLPILSLSFFSFPSDRKNIGRAPKFITKSVYPKLHFLKK